MRNIKFRAFDGRSMIDPYSVRNGKAFVIRPCNTNDPVITGDDGLKYYNNWDTDVATDYPLMQLTGVKDREGVDIYEGDFVNYFGFICEVKWSDDDCGFLFFSFDCGLRSQLGNKNLAGNCLVVGNIHENQDILEGN